MASPEEFAQECEAAAKALRRIPKELRRALAAEVKTEVAEPMASKIRSAARGPWASRLSWQTKARAAADPQVVIGGVKKIVSGGANARQLIYGTEFGGGRRVTRVPARAGRKGYRRESTNQFIQNHTPYVFPTLRANSDFVLDAFADIVLKVINEEVPGG